MPPKKDTKKQAGTLLTDMAHDSNIRTTVKSKKLKDDYDEDLGELEEKIDEKLAENKEALSAIRQDQLTRLLTLIRKRSAIETAIAESHTRLQQSYETASKELRRSIMFRKEEIRKKVADSTAEPEEEHDADGKEENKEIEAPLGAKAGKGLKRRSSGNRAAEQDMMEGVQK